MGNFIQKILMTGIGKGYCDWKVGTLSMPECIFFIYTNSNEIVVQYLEEQNQLSKLCALLF